MTYNKSFGLGLMAINEVHKRIVYMTHEIIFLLFYRWLYNVLCMVFNFHLHGNYHIQEVFRIVANFHTLTNFHTLEIFQTLENNRFMSYLCTLSKLQYASTICIRKQIYRQVYNLFSYALYLYLLILNPMSFVYRVDNIFILFY